MLSRRRILLGGGVVAIVVVALAAVAVWYTLFRDDAPSRVTLSDAVASVRSPQPSPQATAPSSGGPEPSAQPGPPAEGATGADAPTAAPAPAAPAPPAPPADALAGTWVLAPGSDSFVGYRVQEQLARVGAATAVGRTRTVTATLQFDGSTITAVAVTADLRALRSDESLRDGQLRTQALQTNRFPTATFTLTQPIQLGRVPAEGEVVRATAVGDLTLHGVTRSISIPLEGQRTNGRVVVVGSLDIRFADFNIATPRAASVISVEDHGLLELQLIFQKDGQG